MATSAPANLTGTALDPNAPPIRTFEPAALTTPLQKYLSSIGLDKIAQRLADVQRTWKWYKASKDKSDAWREPKFTSMMRTDPYKAKRLAQEHELKFTPFADLIGDHFTRINIRFFAHKTTLDAAEHLRQQALIRTIRKVITSFLPESLDKLGAYPDRHNRYNRVVKVLHAKPVDAVLLAKIQASLPPEASIERHVYPRAAFINQHRLWAHADLPLEEKERADFELLIHGLQQVHVHGVSKELRDQFALKSTNANANPADISSLEQSLDAVIVPTNKKKAAPYVPRSPKTGAYAKYVSVDVGINVTLDEIHPFEWTELPSPE